VPKYFIIPEYAFMIPSTKLLIIPNPAYKKEAYFLYNTENAVKLFSITPQFINIKVDIKTPDMIVINQEYSGGWRTRYGTVSNFNGLLAVKVDSLGQRDILLFFVPTAFYAGVLLSMVVLILSVYLSCFLKQRRCRKAGKSK